MELGVQVKPPEEAKIATKYKSDKYSSSRTRQIQYIRVRLLPNSIPRHRYRPQSVMCAPVEFS
ncbi:hypothetical protein L208DRAFT_1397928 [Tricholoma matsutake]|nr:hypothetical protein L208DRAFT_1397928 [Tricholoma matsutake 945]